VNLDDIARRPMQQCPRCTRMTATSCPSCTADQQFEHDAEFEIPQELWPIEGLAEFMRAAEALPVGGRL
jgi:hypothetical protein